MPSQPQVLIVVALPSEARPLIDCWRMQRDTTSRAFAVYHSQQRTCQHNEKISLVVSGIGKINAAAACAHLYNLCAPQTAVWLNTGIAGHATLPQGAALIAHSIKDAGSGQIWYPPIVFTPACASEAVLSVDTVSDYYPKNTALDREASAFFSVANRYSTAELVHSIKVISDNQWHSHEHITATKAAQWMAGATGLIQQIAQQLLQLASCLPAKETHLPEFMQQHHYTLAQQRQCLDLLRRWRALNTDTPLPETSFRSLASARAVISTLQQQVDALTPDYCQSAR